MLAGFGERPAVTGECRMGRCKHPVHGERRSTLPSLSPLAFEGQLKLAPRGFDGAHRFLTPPAVIVGRCAQFLVSVAQLHDRGANMLVPALRLGRGIGKTRCADYAQNHENHPRRES